MYASRFNYISASEQKRQKILLNFLTRSVDMISERFTLLLSHHIVNKRLTEEEISYMMERGYVYSVRDHEDQALGEFYEAEQKNNSHSYVVHIDSYNPSQMRSNVEKILSTIREIESCKSASEPRSEIIFYCKNIPEYSLVEELEKVANRSCSLNLGNRIIATKRAFPALISLLSSTSINEVTLLFQLEAGNGPFFREHVATLLDEIIERGMDITVNIKLGKKDIGRLHLLMNYLISQGWPFLDNFHCTLEPSSDQGCIFGYFYSSDLGFARNLFEMFKHYPQTEFFSLEKWIGISSISNVIWKGSMSRRSSHFCGASKGLMFFTGSGNTFPCLKMVEKLNNGRGQKANELKAFTQTRKAMLARCHSCSFIPSCGCGCIYQALKRKTKGARCPPMGRLIELSLEMYFEELIEKSKFCT